MSGAKSPERNALDAQLLLTSFLEALGAEAFVKDRDSRYQLVNHFFEKTWGVSREDVIGRDDAFVFGAETAAELRAVDLRIMETQVPEDVEYEGTHKDGRRYVWRTHKAPLVDANGQSTGICGVGFDITSQRQADQAVQASEARLTDIVAAIPDAVTIVDRDCTVLWANRVAADLVGSDPVGRHWYEMVHGHSERCPDCSIERVLETGQAWQHEYEATTTVDGPLTLLASCPATLLLITRDVTERRVFERSLLETSADLERQVAERVAEIERSRRAALSLMQDANLERERAEQALAELDIARKQAESASLAKTRFLANMSHEIRTPLHAIVGYGDLLRRDGELGHTQAEYVGVISDSSHHLAALIDDLLEMSKIEAGRSDLLPSHFDLHQVLAEVEALFRARAAAKGIVLTLKLGEALPRELHGDERKVRQVVVNMVSNALRYTDSGGVEIRAALAESSTAALRIVVEVADTGCGIDPSELGLVFDPFEQAADGRRRGEGTGLGMPISRAFARLMGGDLTVTSEPGVGSTFRFEFLAEPSRSVARTTPRTVGNVVSIAGPAREWRALVVDDLAVDRTIVVRLLEIVGFAVRDVSSGEEAVETAVEWRPDVVLLDQRMPGMSGLETARTLRDRLAGDVPIVMVSAGDVDKRSEEVAAAGVRGFVSKPVFAERLYDAVARAAGIEFVSEQETAGVAAEGPPPPPSPDAAALIATLPADLRGAMRTAVEMGDLARLAEIVAALDGEHAVAGSLVTEFARGYQYDRLLEVL
jgi:PAS domain S-box-containing protein